MSYEAKGEQDPSDLVDRYADFSTWSKKLSTVLHRDPPALARVRLNDRLKEMDWKVTQIKCTSGPKTGNDGEARSIHAYRYDITDEDRDLVRTFEKEIAELELVDSFLKFRELQEPLRVATKK